jgi:hypothetical protein
MSTLNGIGLRFLAITPIDEQECCYVTQWVTVLYFPIIPIRRLYIQRFFTHSTDFEYVIIRKDALQWKEILLTYIFGYLIFPFIVIAPVVLAIREVAESIGVQTEYMQDGKMHSTFIYNAMVTAAIVWLGASVLAISYWDNHRGLPKKK